MSAAKQLYELQEIDLDRDAKTHALNQLRSQLGQDDDLVKARVSLDAVRKHLTDLEHQQRTAEFEIDELGAKIANEEKKLYEGSVKNPRELMGLQQEIDLLKEQHSEREEQLLNTMIEVDSAQQDVNHKSTELDNMESNWQKEQQYLVTEQAELEADLTSLEQKRAIVLQQIDQASVKLYEELRQAKQGRAVAKVEQGRCQGCRISLPVSDQQRARMGHELATCSNCSRILWAG